jgi:Sulfotransferase domain
MPARSDVARRLTPRSVRRSRARRRAGLGRTGRIFGIGLSRTGTTSLTGALDMLGYRTFHFPADDASRERIMALLAEGGDCLRLPLLDRIDVATDTPVCASFEALDACYPGSKFILTTRDRQSWLDSCDQLWASWATPYLRDHSGEPLAVFIGAINEALYGGSTFDRERLSRAYEHYEERVRQHFRARPGDLLTVDICAGAGWEPLCGFLNLPIPDAPFPWTIHAEGDWRDAHRWRGGRA